MEKDDETTVNLMQELKRGTLVLSVLLCTDVPGYGYALVSRLKDQGIEIEQNTLYPLLRRLEKQGLLESKWDTSEARPRRYYATSKKGRKARDRLLEEWKSLDEALRELERAKGGIL
ncbi:MAG: PadR family transcriptional regulator [Treponema sp.]|jgi:DNA-binding PadR family transcriptional regulator|nr:MAG: PadR family transcriptional regulator [Treponema sp.]